MTIISCLLAEITKELVETRRYVFNLATSIVVQTMMFVGFMFLAIGYSPVPVSRSETSADSFILVGYLVWTFAMFALNNMGLDITTETTTGTFEQKCMAAAPIPVMLAGRALGNIIVSFGYVAVLLLVITLITGTKIGVPVTVIPVIMLTLIGVYGLGYAIAGAAIVYKRVGQAAYAIQMLLLFFGGLANESVDPSVLRMAEYLPLTLGVAATRTLSLDGGTLTGLVQDGMILRIALNSLCYLVAGLVVFNYSSRVARARGSLGKY